MFIPVLFMGGIVGRLLHEFAVTIGVAILVSGFVSLTLTPMLCGRLLQAGTRAEHGRMYNVDREHLRGWPEAYGWTLQSTLKHRA